MNDKEFLIVIGIYTSIVVLFTIVMSLIYHFT